MFFLPYAVYMVRSAWKYGQSPPVVARCFVTLLVTCGNQIMYAICDTLSRMVGFRHEDTREVAYIMWYLGACLINVGLDLLVTGIQTRARMQHGAFMASAELYGYYDSYADILRSYPLQATLGQQVYHYAFPSCFLLPFVAEGVFAILMPLHIQKLLVRCSPKLAGRAAERALDYFMPMNLGRYADVMLNAILVTIGLFFACGPWDNMFLAFAGCQIFIILYDHFRVLRGVPSFTYASDVVDRVAQAIFVIPCGLILVSVCWNWLSKRNVPLEKLRNPHLDALDSDARVFIACFSAFLLHCLVHWFVLFVGVPMMRRIPHVRSKMRFAEVARRRACTWFSANPVHCLRSRHIYKQDPPCSYWIRGKECLMKANPSIGTYFESTGRNEGLQGATASFVQRS
mmetsp:Transcript_65649/g.140355  ORF Transcript_65649/g.140355 Transcript_65649/m.140355 type:complete len:400 (+) Transcript_65649:3-1202(+)